MYKVTVNQKSQNANLINTCVFGFNKFGDATEFVSTCLECGDKGTQVIVEETEEDWCNE